MNIGILQLQRDRRAGELLVGFGTHDRGERIEIGRLQVGRPLALDGHGGSFSGERNPNRDLPIISVDLVLNLRLEVENDPGIEIRMGVTRDLNQGGIGQLGRRIESLPSDIGNRRIFESQDQLGRRNLFFFDVLTDPIPDNFDHTLVADSFHLHGLDLTAFGGLADRHHHQNRQHE